MCFKNILQHGLSSCYCEFSNDVNIECIAFHININKDIVKDVSLVD